ncbi:MAG: DNA primase [Cellvibrionaceae bacterium]|nr:DNA primase [Cellvibrionaceae bacterium]
MAMKGRIPQSFLDDLLDRLDIVDVVDHRVKLKKSGKNYSACCPFHDEKTPSFTVSPDKQFYYCFGCGASGNALGFIMEYEHLDFPAAVEELAKLAGVEVPRENVKTSPAQKAREVQRQEILELLSQADDYYQGQLRDHPKKNQAINYLKGRGLSGAICKAFGIGFCPPGWDNLHKHCTAGQEGGKHSHTTKRLEEAGLLVHNPEKQRHYDRFRERIMFPIRDRRGRVIGFGGRVLGDAKPKYLNSPETPVFHKGKELYGLWEARQALSQIPRLLVVEGYMDVVALAQYGIPYGVATLGTACGEEHLQLAFKHTQEVVFCFDGDEAGRNAAKRALTNSLPAMTDGRQIKFLFLDEGQDPDSYVRQIGTEKFLERLQTTASPLEDFLFDSLSEDLDPASMGGKALLSKRAAPLLNLLPKGVYRELMFNNLAKRTDLPLDTLMELIEQPLPKLEQTATPQQKNLAPSGEPEPPNPIQEPQHGPEDEAPDYQGMAEYFGAGEELGPAEAPPQHGYQDADYQDYSVDPDDDTQAGQPETGASLSLQRLLIGLLVETPALAEKLENIDIYQQLNDTDSELLLRLCQCLQSRPHYNVHQLAGHWLASYGEADWQRLKAIAEQASDHLKAAKKRPGFDEATELVASHRRLAEQHQQRQNRRQISALRGKKPAELSEEEKQLYRQYTQTAPKPGS